MLGEVWDGDEKGGGGEKVRWVGIGEGRDGGRVEEVRKVLIESDDVIK